MEHITKRAYQESIKLLHSLSTPQGFVASAISIDNYHRIFARDAMIALLASLLAGDEKLIGIGRKTLITLARYQDATGRIASNISADGKKVSYGTQVGRIDATTWFVIGTGQYVKRMKDMAFAKKMYRHLKKAMDYLSAIETNGKGLLYIPHGGDWSDEYLNHGYVLYDQLLYLQAQKDFFYIQKKIGRVERWRFRKIRLLKRQLLVNFIPPFENLQDEAVYQKGESFEKLLRRFKKPYALAYFVQGEIGDYFDAFANSLILIFLNPPADFKKRLLRYCFRMLAKQKVPILPAFSPVIKKNHPEKDHHKWKMLQFSYVFRKKNNPYHYHNGGLWPLIQGFFIVAITRHGQIDRARKLTESFAQLLADDKFRFAEYYDGKHGLPCGTTFLGFSASAYILAHEASLNGKRLFL